MRHLGTTVMQPEPPPVVIDVSRVECCYCGRTKEFYHDAPLVGAQAVLEWTEHLICPCPCGGRTVNIAHRVKK